MKFEKFIKLVNPSSSLPVWQISDSRRPTIHRFFDTSPISPSGRLVALTRLPYDDRTPCAGDVAEVVVLDLTTGDEIYSGTTSAWDSQLGAQVQWGATDNELLYNVMDETHWRPYANIVDPFSRTAVKLDHTVYMCADNGKIAASPCLIRIQMSQPGYGVHVPPSILESQSFDADKNYIIITDVEKKTTERTVTLTEILDYLPEIRKVTNIASGKFHIFHTKWNSDGSRLMIVLRFQKEGQNQREGRTWLITTDRYFRRYHIALPPENWIGGHHPTWCDDNDTIIMNVNCPIDRTAIRNAAWSLQRTISKIGVKGPQAVTLRFAMFKFDGSNFQVFNRSAVGSGHPSYSNSRDAVIADAYAHETVSDGDGTVPLRYIPRNGPEHDLFKIDVHASHIGSKAEWRLDPHPAWCRKRRYVTFNGMSSKVRSVFIADMAKYNLEN